MRLCLLAILRSKRCLQDVHDLAPLDQQLEQEHQEKTKVKNIQVKISSQKHCLAPEFAGLCMFI